MAKKFMWFVEKHDNDDVGGLLKEPLEVMRPGFVRINLPYFMSDRLIDFVLNAINMVATHGWKLLPQYHFDPQTGGWEHKQFKKDKGESLFSLHDISYDEAGMIFNSTETCREYRGTLEDIAEAATRVFEDAVNVNKEISTLEDEVIEFKDDKNQLVWFLQPNEAQFYLAAETLKFKPKPFGKAKNPFSPRHGRSPQITPANSNPSLHKFKVTTDDESNGSAGSLVGSAEHANNLVVTRKAWAPEEMVLNQSITTKKETGSFSKLKNLFRKVGKR